MKTTNITYLPKEVLIIENDRILSIPYFEIKIITCDKPYILVETISKKYHLSQNLSGFCAGLPSFIMQSDKSTYINLLQITAIHKSKSGYTARIQGASYSISRRRIAEIKVNFLKIKTKSIEAGNCHICMNCKTTV